MIDLWVVGGGLVVILALSYMIIDIKNKFHRVMGTYDRVDRWTNPKFKEKR